MKHFIVEITYTVEPEELGERVGEHRAFLRSGYEQGLLLFSGPQTPRIGGIAVARAESLEAIETFFRDDPYLNHGLATYRFIQFEPILQQDFMAAWIA